MLKLKFDGTIAPIDGESWLAGYAAYEVGDPCPWGSAEDDDNRGFSAREGWIAAKTDGAPR